MITALRRRFGRATSRGQAMVEFALVAPIFFVLLFAVIEGGRFIFYYETLNNATREGERYAIVHGATSYCPSGPMDPSKPTPLSCYDPPGTNIIDRVKQTAFGIPGSSITVTPSWPTHNGWNQQVTVTASYQYQTLVPIIPLPPITINAESTGVINY